MIVTPKTIPVRHNGVRYNPGEEFEIESLSYKRIADHLEVIDDGDSLVGNKPMEKWSVAELKAFAEEKVIDLGEATKKPEILKVIEDALAVVGGGSGGDQ